MNLLCLLLLIVNACFINCDESNLISLSCDNMKLHKLFDSSWTEVKTVSDCNPSKEQLLKICQENYPEVELDYFQEINSDNYERLCNEDSMQCKQQLNRNHKVYMCIKFLGLSEALVVEDSCQFSHLIDREQCSSALNVTSQAKLHCQLKNMQIQRAKGIFPCNRTHIKSGYHGIQFVCCPPMDLVSNKNNEAKQSNKVKPRVQLNIVKTHNITNNTLISMSCNDMKLHRLSNSSWTEIKAVSDCNPSKEQLLKICQDNYSEIEFDYFQEINSDNYEWLCNEDSKQCKQQLNRNHKVYMCMKFLGLSEALVVDDGCQFSHLFDREQCASALNVTSQAKLHCQLKNMQMRRASGIIPCTRTHIKSGYQGIQFVCCPPMDYYQFYMNHATDEVKSVQHEIKLYLNAKSTLRQRFSIPQRKIEERFVDEENSVAKNHNLNVVSQLETQFQNKFRSKFLREMKRESIEMNNLEMVHEKRLEIYFENERKKSKDRFLYSLQETQPKSSRISKALRLELEAILQEAEEIIEFFQRLYDEGLNQTQYTLNSIKNRFDSLVIMRWNDVLQELNKVEDKKDDILRQINDLELSHRQLIEKFQTVFAKKPTYNTINHQSEVFIKNIIGLNSHGILPVSITDDQETNIMKPLYIGRNYSVVLFVFLGTLIIVVFTLIVILMVRQSKRINYYLTVRFKKLQRSCLRKNPSNPMNHTTLSSSRRHKLLLDQSSSGSIGNIRDNCSASVGAIYLNSANTDYPHEQQLMEIISASSSRTIRESPESQRFGGLHSTHQGGIITTNDCNLVNSFNINGLENPICRLLDEK